MVDSKEPKKGADVKDGGNDWPMKGVGEVKDGGNDWPMKGVGEVKDGGNDWPE